jgi:hypothetical protein
MVPNTTVDGSNDIPCLPEVEGSGRKWKEVERSGTKWNEVERSGTKWNDMEMCLQYFITIPTQLGLTSFWVFFNGLGAPAGPLPLCSRVATSEIGSCPRDQIADYRLTQLVPCGMAVAQPTPTWHRPTKDHLIQTPAPASADPRTLRRRTVHDGS